MNDEAILSSSGDFTCFAYGGRKIRFMTSPYLERYVEVKEWDSSIGYIVVTARYRDEDVEDYIGLLEILENLYIDPVEFLKPIKRVRISYDPSDLGYSEKLQNRSSRFVEEEPVVSTRDRAAYIFDRLSEEQLEAFVTLFGRTFIPEEEPDEWDREMIERRKKENSESVPLEQVAAEMGFSLDNLQ